MDQYALVYFPSIDTTTINSFRKNYDPMYEIIAPHVTIVFPFKYLPEEKIVRHIQKMIEKQKSFPIHLHGFIKSFDHYLFLLVDQGKEEIYKLHNELYTDILAPELRADIPFIPHLTLGFFQNQEGELNENLYKKALEEAEELTLDFHTTFDNLTLIKGDGIKQAEIIRIFAIT